MIHQYKLEEFCIVLDTNSGAVHVVDDMIYEMIRALDETGYEEAKRARFDCLRPLEDRYSKEEMQEALSEIEALTADGLLFSEDPYEAAAEMAARRETVVKALCLHVAHDCNLRCRYCFAEEGDYHGQRELMSFETGKKALDFLVRASGSRRNLEVDFFGGEPLMNLDVVRRLVEYGRSLEEPFHKHFRFTLTTNGVLLNEETMRYLNDTMDNVVLSIDGRKSVHDAMRRTANGKGSYDLVLPKFRRMAELRNQTRYYVRGTFTSQNLDFSKDVLHLADLGFKQISIEPVVADPSEPYAIRREHLPRIFAEYETLAHEMRVREREGRGFVFFHYMMDLSQGPCLIKRLSGCGSGCEYLAVHPNGGLYPCHQFVGQEDFRMGSVDTGIERWDLYNRFKNVTVYAKPGCRDCWARFYCSGGCAANAWQFAGDLNGNYEIGCEMERKRIECAIMLQAAKSGDNAQDAAEEMTNPRANMTA